MLSRSNSRTTASYGADGKQLVRTSPSPQEITAREIDEEFAWLDGNFAANLPLEHSRSMSKMVDVCIWWYLKVCIVCSFYIVGNY